METGSRSHRIENATTTSFSGHSRPTGAKARPAYLSTAPMNGRWWLDAQTAIKWAPLHVVARQGPISPASPRFSEVFGWMGGMEQAASNGLGICRQPLFSGRRKAWHSHAASRRGGFEKPTIAGATRPTSDHGVSNKKFTSLGDPDITANFWCRMYGRKRRSLLLIGSHVPTRRVLKWAGPEAMTSVKKTSGRFSERGGRAGSVTASYSEIFFFPSIFY